MADDNQKLLTLQIGVLMQTLGVIVQQMGKDPAFRFEVRHALQHYSEVMQSHAYSDQALDLVNETIQSILAGLPAE